MIPIIIPTTDYTPLSKPAWLAFLIIVSIIGGIAVVGVVAGFIIGPCQEANKKKRERKEREDLEAINRASRAGSYVVPQMGEKQKCYVRAWDVGVC